MGTPSSSASCSATSGRLIPRGFAGATLADSVPARVSDLILHRLGRLPAPVADAVDHGVGRRCRRRHRDAGRSPRLRRRTGARSARPGPSRRTSSTPRRPVGGSSGTSSSATPCTRARSARDRVRRHALVLEVLAADPSTPAPTVAHHALAAHPLFDADRAVALAARAGESAFAHHAYEEAVAWFTQALAAAPPETAPRWRAELLVLCGEAHRHIGDIDAARRVLRAGGRADRRAGAARPRGARLRRSRRRSRHRLPHRGRGDRPRCSSGRSRRSRASDCLTAVQLEARLAAELYFSDDPIARPRARTVCARASPPPRRPPGPRLRRLRSCTTHSWSARPTFDDQLDGVGAAARVGPRDRIGRSVADRAPRPRLRPPRGGRPASDGRRDPRVPPTRRAAPRPGYLWWPALWSAMRALLEGRHEAAEARALAAYQVGEGPFPLARRSSTSRSCCSSSAVSRAGSTRWSRPPATTRRPMPTFPRFASRSPSCSRSSAGSTRREPRWRRSTTSRSRPPARPQLARVVVPARSRRVDRRRPRPRRDAPRARAPPERAVRPGLPRHRLPRCHRPGGGVAAPHRRRPRRRGRAYRAAAELNARIGARSWLAQTRADHAAPAARARPCRRP